MKRLVVWISLLMLALALVGCGSQNDTNQIDVDQLFAESGEGVVSVDPADIVEDPETPAEEAEPESEPDSQPEVATEPQAESTPEAATEAPTEAEGETTPEPAVEVVPEPVEEPATETPPETTPDTPPETQPEPVKEPQRPNQAQRELYVDGKYTVTVKGFKENLIVEVAFRNDRIIGVRVKKSSETPRYLRRAMPTMAERIVEAQTWKVDTVSNATFSSDGIRKAVRKAVRKAMEDAAVEE